MRIVVICNANSLSINLSDSDLLPTRHFLQLGVIGARTSLMPRLAMAQPATGDASQILMLA
jgi:hypothetical protein